MKTKIDQALSVAKEIHKDQRRANGDPYFNHIDLVYRILSHWATDDDMEITYNMIVAGCLHDVIEDGSDKITYDDISKQFGYEVRNYVEELTNNKYGTYLDYLLDLNKHTKESDQVLMIKKADMIANYYDVINNPGNNKHQMKHLKNKAEMAFYILFGEKIWEEDELQMIKDGEI